MGISKLLWKLLVVRKLNSPKTIKDVKYPQGRGELDNVHWCDQEKVISNFNEILRR